MSDSSDEDVDVYGGGDGDDSGIAALLDNMNLKNLRESVKIVKKLYETEASGNVSLKTVKAIASTGVNRISVGSITHSAPGVDFKLEI